MNRPQRSTRAACPGGNRANQRSTSTTASSAAILAIGKPVAFDASADERETRCVQGLEGVLLGHLHPGPALGQLVQGGQPFQVGRGRGLGQGGHAPFGQLAQFGFRAAGRAHAAPPLSLVLTNARIAALMCSGTLAVAAS